MKTVEEIAGCNLLNKCSVQELEEFPARVDAERGKDAVGTIGELFDECIIADRKLDRNTKLFLSPTIPEGMALVTKEDGENYCRILSMLGMEEEGSPVSGIERLIMLRDGMVCGDCNDTGWLENREEGK